MDSHPDSRRKTLINTNTLCMGKEDRKRGGGRERGERGEGEREARREGEGEGEREMFWRQNCFNIKKKKTRQGVSVEVS